MIEYRLAAGAEVGRLRARADAAEAQLAEVQRAMEMRTLAMRDVVRQRDALRVQLAEAQRAYNICALHQPDIWEGDGTCVICEGNDLLIRAEAAEQQLADAQAAHPQPSAAYDIDDPLGYGHGV